MSDSIEFSSNQHLAALCLAMLLNPHRNWPVGEEELGALRETLGPGISAPDIENFGQRLRDSERFRQGHQEIASRWSSRWTEGQPPNEQQALEFLEDFFSLLDHGIFFDQGVTASSTHVRRDTATTSELDFPGGMPCWTLHLTTEGEGLYLNDNIELQAVRGHMMLFHPEAHYHYGLAPAAEEWQHLWALFQPRAHWGEWMAWESVDEGIFHMVLPDEASSAQLQSLFQSLIELRSRDLAYRADLEHTRLEEILIRARGLQSQSRDRKPIDSRVSRACEYIESQADGSFSVDDIASACNLSSSRLAHLFKQQIGVGPMAWSNNLRLQRARKLLLDSDKPVAMIAAQVGYEDPTQFARNFRKNVGCSPREFRKSFRRQGVAP
jgi:AraC family transcriptional regulator, arabinose operon regulatory protein